MCDLSYRHGNLQIRGRSFSHFEPKTCIIMTLSKKVFQGIWMRRECWQYVRVRVVVGTKTQVA